MNAAEPGPKQLQRAQRKLSTVTACSTLRGPPNPDRNASHGKPEGDDVEATAAQLEMGEWSVFPSELELPLRASQLPCPPAVQTATAMPAQAVQG